MDLVQIKLNQQLLLIGEEGRDFTLEFIVPLFFETIQNMGYSEALIMDFNGANP